MELMHPLDLVAVANYPGPAVMGFWTLALFGFIIGGGYWMKHMEAKSRAEERAFQNKDS